MTDEKENTEPRKESPPEKAAQGKAPDELERLIMQNIPASKETSSSISRRLEAMLQSMAEEHSWGRIEQKVIETIDRVPQVAETALSSWLWWLIAVTGLGVVTMGWLRTSEMLSWQRDTIQAMLPALGNSLLIVSALALIWAGRSGARPAGEDTEFGTPSLRWLIIGAGWAAALMGALVAFLPAASAGRVPSDLIPFIIISAVSGLAASWALELRHQNSAFSISPDSFLRQVSIGAGILLIAIGSVLQIYFLVLHR